MQTIRTSLGTTALFVGLGLLAAPGCTGLRAKANGLASQADPPGQGAFAAKPQNDTIGRPAPGSPPLPAVDRSEQPPELSSETRSHVALAMGQMLEGAGKLSDAQICYEQAIKLDPKSLKATLALARVYSQLGRPDAAIRLYASADKQHHKEPALYNDKGLHLAEQNDWPAAIEALRKAVKLDRSNSKYHNNLGMVLAVSGDYGEAWKEFREAVGAGPAHYNVALMLARAGRAAEARDHLERALTVMPGLKEAEQLLAQINSKPPEPLSQNGRHRHEGDLELNLKTASQEVAAADKSAVVPPVLVVRLAAPVMLDDDDSTDVATTADAATSDPAADAVPTDDVPHSSWHEGGDPWITPRVAGKWLR